MVEIDYWRQLDVFAPQNFSKPIHVIGAGATGSTTTLILAKIGCRDITVYDFDIIENYNIPNTIYTPEDVGKLKVDALNRIIREQTNIEIKTVAQKAEGKPLCGIVFLLTDTMQSRKDIWQNAVRYQLSVDLLIETRMGAEGGMLYAVKPLLPNHVKEYEKTFYDDSEAEESPCTNRAFAPNVFQLSSNAVEVFKLFATGKDFPNEILFSLPSFLISTRKF